MAARRMRGSLGFAGWLIPVAMAAVVGPGVAEGQAPGRDAHQWVVLLDESSSVLDVEGSMTAGGAGGGDYSLRAELMTLLESMIAARSRTMGAPRTDDLTVFHFGRGVIRASRQGPVTWETLPVEADWRTNFPSSFRGQTWLNEALTQARDYLQQFGPEVHKHLIIISDGELDVEPTVRAVGARPAQEELAEYRTYLLRAGSELHEDLARLGVEITALVLEESHATSSDQSRRQEIYEQVRQADGANNLARTMALVEDYANGSWPGARSEGPYVLFAIADRHRGQPRFVSQSNVQRVLWETLFPEQEFRRGMVARNATRAVLFTPTTVPVPVTVQHGGVPRDVRLSWRRDGSGFDKSPADVPLTVEAKPTTNFVTWLIESDSLLGVDPPEGSEALLVENVDLEWRPDAPPTDVALDRPVPIELELRQVDYRPGWTVEQWRRDFSDRLGEVRAAAIVDEPNGDSFQVQLRPRLGTEGSTVLVLEGVFDRPRVPGTHRVRATVEDGSGVGAFPRSSVVASFRALELTVTAPALFIEDGRRRVPLASVAGAASAVHLTLPASVSFVAEFPEHASPFEHALVDSVGVRPSGGTQWTVAEASRATILRERAFDPLVLDGGGPQTVRVWAAGQTFDFYTIIEADRTYLWLLLGLAVLAFILPWMWSAAPWAPDDVLVRTWRGEVGYPAGRSIYLTWRAEGVTALSRWTHPFLLWAGGGRRGRLSPRRDGEHRFKAPSGRDFAVATLTRSEWRGIRIPGRTSASESDVTAPEEGGDPERGDESTVVPGARRVAATDLASGIAGVRTGTRVPAQGVTLRRRDFERGSAVLISAAGARDPALVRKEPRGVRRPRGGGSTLPEQGDE